MARNRTLSVLTLGDPRLRLVARPVEQIDDRLQTLIDTLIWTAEKTNGVGIAAPQVGASLRLFVVASRPNLRYPNAPLMEPTAMINPRILAHSDAQVAGWEGCLSVPDQRGQVERSPEIEVEYCDRTGAFQRTVLTDFVARIFQHEHDHLEGTVFVDRVADPSQLISEAEYFKQLKAVSAIPGSESPS
ncbi:MAG: peptide deformylase [Leptolyngbya sp. SIO1D8]|nr:peptide deformylase [Leptolyngbya sp. SIO1D8]